MNISGEKFLLRYPLLGLLGGTLAFPICFIVAAFFSGGGGHDLTSLKVAFPYAMLWGFGGPRQIGLALLYLQFPLYGLVVGFVMADDRLRWLIITLVTAHLLAVLWSVAVYFHPPEGLTTLPLDLNASSYR